jgi:hypothetical protein
MERSCGSAARSCGKARPFRKFVTRKATPCGQGAALPTNTRPERQNLSLEFGLLPMIDCPNYGATDLESAFLRLRMEEIVEAKPEKSQPATRAVRIQPRVKRALLASETLGLRKEIGSPRSGRSKPVGTGRVPDLEFQREDFGHPLRGSVLISPIPRVPLRTSLRFGAPLHPGLYSDRPPSRACVDPKGQTPRKGRAFPHKRAAKLQEESTFGFAQ